MTTSIQNPTTVNMPTQAQSKAQPQMRPEASTRERDAQRVGSGKSLPLEAAQERHREPPSEAEVEHAVELFTQHAASIGRDLLFEIDDESGQTVIKVIDPETEELVRQIPSEEAVARARSRGVEGMNLIDDSI